MRIPPIRMAESEALSQAQVSAPESSKWKVVPKHSLATRWFHWINFPVMAIMVWSGLIIYWANDEYTLHLFGKQFHFFPTETPADRTLFPWGPANWYHPSIGGHELFRLDARLGEGRAWHYVILPIFVVNGILYFIYLIASKSYKELFPDRKSWRQAIDVILVDSFLSKKKLPKQKFNGAQKVTYTGIIFLGGLEAITGLVMVRPVQFPWLAALVGGYQTARLIHFIAMLAFVGFFVIHVVQVVRAGWNNFRSMITGYELEAKEEAA